MKKILSGDHTVAIAPTSIIFAILFLLGLYFLYQIKVILVLFLLSFIVTVALKPAVAFFQRKLKISKLSSMGLTYLILTSSIVAVFALVIPPLARQVVQLINSFDIPLIQEQLQVFNFTLQELSSIIKDFSGSFNIVFEIINTTFTALFEFITVLILSFYLMLERPVLHQKASWFTKKPENLKKVEDFINTLELQLGGWVRAQLLIMFVVFLMTYAGLLLLSIPYALPLALLAGLLEILPNLGPLLSMIPTLLVTLILLGPVMALVVVLLYVVIQQFESMVLTPNVMRESAHVNPVIAILTILTGLTLGGVMGALLAIPVYIILRVSYSSFFEPLNS
jgi:predicted PurR-regulated permease PerM